jgi:hypothetical protein
VNVSLTSKASRQPSAFASGARFAVKRTLDGPWYSKGSSFTVIKDPTLHVQNDLGTEKMEVQMPWRMESMQLQKKKFITLWETGRFTKTYLCEEFGISRPNW